MVVCMGWTLPIRAICPSPRLCFSCTAGCADGCTLVDFIPEHSSPCVENLLHGGLGIETVALRPTQITTDLDVFSIPRAEIASGSRDMTLMGRCVGPVPFRGSSFCGLDGPLMGVWMVKKYGSGPSPGLLLLGTDLRGRDISCWVAAELSGFQSSINDWRGTLDTN